MTATEKSKLTDEAQVQAVIEHWANALRAKDVDGVMSDHAANFVHFALAPPLQYARGHALDKKGLREWFSSFEGPIGYEIRDLSIAAGDNTAYSHSLNRINGTRTSGEKTEMWFRATMCFRKIGGRWKITHEHESVPFYMDGSVRAAIDLKP